MLAPASRLAREAGFTLLRCPSCATAEAVPTADLAGPARLIVCSRCGARLPERELRRARRGSAHVLEGRAAALSAAPPQPDEPAEDGVQAQAIGHRPEKAGAARWRPRLAVAACAAALFAAGFTLGRGAATAAAPSLAGLTAAIGLAAERPGLHVEALAAERDGGHLSLSGRLVNATGRKVRAGDLAVETQDAAGRVTSVTLVPAPAPLLEPGTAADFTYRLDEVPLHVAAVRVRPGGPAQPEPTGATP